MGADDAAAVETALDIALGADEHAIAELARIEVLEARASVDPQVPAGTLGGRSPDGAAHQRFEGAIAGHKAAVEVDETFVRELASQPFGEIADKRREERPGLEAMDGFDQPSPASRFR